MGSKGSIRTSLLINSLGLESSGVKGRKAVSKVNLKEFSSHEESDSQSASSESSDVTPSKKMSDQVKETSLNSTTTAQCQQCHVNTMPAIMNMHSNLQTELESIKAEMKKANSTINSLQEREKRMKDRYIIFFPTDIFITVIHDHIK